MAQAFASARALGGFGAARPLSLRAIVLTAAAHAVALPLAISLGNHAIAAPEERLTLVDLTASAAPEPPPPAPPDAPTDPAPPPPSAVPAPALALAEPEAALAAPAPVPATPARPTAAAPAPAATAPGSAAARTAAAGPAMIASDALDATLIAGNPPRYPHESRRKREQGTVELLVTVGTDGAVETIAVARSSGSPRLDAAALAAVRGWRWQPVRRGGEAVRVRGIIEIPFILTSGRKGPHRADCNSPDSHCRPDERPARDHRHGRMDRRDGDLGPPGPDGEE